MKNQNLTAGMQLRAESPSNHLDPYKVYQSIIDVVVAIDARGYFQFVSPACADLFGYTPEEMTGSSFLMFIHPDDIEKTQQSIADKTHDCRTSNFANRYIKRDGSIAYIIWSARWDDNDKLLYCVARDGSEQRAIEQRLHKAQKLAKIANFEYDLVSDKYSHLSDTFFEVFGLDPKHPVFNADIFWSMVHPDDVKKVTENLTIPDQLDNSIIEYRIIKPSGALAYIHRTREVIRDAAGNHIKTIGTVQDITDRKISELALLQREERFRSLVQNGNDMIGIIDANGEYIFVGTNVNTHLGYNSEDLVGKNAFQFIHPEDQGWVMDVLLEITGASHIVTPPPFRFKNAAGEWRWMEVTITNHLEDAIIGGIVVNSRDITEKKQKDDELKTLSLIAKHTNNPVIIQDENRKVLWVNNAFTQLSGYSFEECIGEFIGVVCDGPATDPQTLNYVQQKVQKKEPFRIETINYKKNGDRYWSDVSCKPIFNDKGEVIKYFSIAIDITERKQFEKQLRKEQHDQQVKISAATLKAQEHERTVVSQELHDNVNQVLTTVKLYTEMCRDGFGDTKEMMNKSIHLLQDSINEIRSLSKRLSAPSLGKIKLSESIKELVEAVGATNKFEILLDISGVELLEVTQEVHLAVYRILQEHITNILKYAGASAVAITADYILGHIDLQVKDDGIGFDPGKKRNGIGITNMITRAESLKGKLQIISAPGNGCELKVNIPL